MSTITYKRLPAAVRQFFKVYGYCVDIEAGYLLPMAKQYLQSHSIQHSLFVRNKLVTGGIVNVMKLPQVQRQLLEPLFLTPYVFDDLECLLTEQLFKDQYNAEKNKRLSNVVTKQDESTSLDGASIPSVGERLTRIPSNTKNTNQNHSSFHANLMKSFASFYSPIHEIPNHVSYQNVYRWFHRLLENTPVVLVLTQKNTLLSNATINQLNLPYNELKQHINQLSSTFNTSRSYHITELIDLDILGLAVKSQNQYNEILASNKGIESMDFSKVSINDDPFCGLLSKIKNVKLLKNRQISSDSLESVFSQFPVTTIKQQLEYHSIQEIFPYDLQYNNCFLLTIEQPIINENHEKLIETLVKFNGHFDISAIRLSTTNKSLRHSIESPTIESPDTYEDLISFASKTQSNVDLLIRNFAELGMVNVAANPTNNCIYLFNH